MDFNSIDELYNYLNNSVNIATVHQASKLGKDVLKKEIDYAYTEYTPKRYKRRYHKDGGFGDESNINIDVDTFRNNVNVKITNKALARGNDAGDELSEIIEEGIYQTEPCPPPRPVFKRADKLMNKNKDLLERRIAKELNSFGIDTTTK